MIPGLENAKILRHGYAVEYDMVWPTQIRSHARNQIDRGIVSCRPNQRHQRLRRSRRQGLMAGINAAHFAAGGLADFVLRRDQAYIGVLIDDLVTKPPTEPYRMFTSRAEHRLHLRADNADERLTPIGRRLGSSTKSVGEDLKLAATQSKMESQRFVNRASMAIARRRISPPSRNRLGNFVANLPAARGIPPDIARLIEIRVKYEGYIARQDQQIERFAKLEHN